MVPKYVRLARERQQRDLVEGPSRGLVWDQKEADRVVGFFHRYLKHWKGEWAGKPFNLEPWQADDILRPVFGWKRADGTRRFRIAYIEIPRKNGKSTLAAGVGLYLTIADREPGAEVYCSATKKDQAKIVFGDAKAMIQQSSELSEYTSWFTNNIHCSKLNSKMEPLGADRDTLDGLNTHGNIIDELHAHKTRGLWDVLITSEGSRRQPLNWIITTAGLYNPESIGWEQHQYGTNVLEGVFDDDSFFAYISGAEKDDDWNDPEVWKSVNPNFGVSVKEDYLKEEADRASRSPAFLNTFLRLHLDVWTEQIDRAIDPRDWDACGGEVDEDELTQQDCYVGLDLATKLDIAAASIYFPAERKVVWRFYVPKENVQDRVLKDRVPYDAWIRDGYLIATPGNKIDQDFIRQDINELGEKFWIQEVACDPWNASQLMGQLDGDGFQVVEVRQGYASLNEPTKEFLSMVHAHELKHGDNPVARWMANNLALKEDPAGNLKPDKSASHEKIDGMVALITGLSRALYYEEGSVYDERGITFL